MASSKRFERGALVSVLGKGDYQGKPRPAVVLQHQRHALDSAIVCPLTSTPIDVDIPYRVRMEPSRRNGLKVTSWAMADKTAAISRERIAERFGTVDQDVLDRIAIGLAVLIEP